MKFLTVMSERLFKGPHRVGYGSILSTEIKHCDVVISSPSAIVHVLYSEQLSDKLTHASIEHTLFVVLHLQSNQ